MAHPEIEAMGRGLDIYSITRIPRRPGRSSAAAFHGTTRSENRYICSARLGCVAAESSWKFCGSVDPTPTIGGISSARLGAVFGIDHAATLRRPSAVFSAGHLGI